MSEALSTQFKSEGQPAFSTQDNGNDNHSDPSSDNTNGGQGPSSEGGDNQTVDKGPDAGFADHPRWKERENDWTSRFNDQEKRHAEELSKFRQEMDEKYGKAGGNKPATELPEKIPGWFGGNEEQWQEFRSWSMQNMEQATNKVREQLTQAEQEQQKRVDDATAYFENEVKVLESDKAINPQGVKVDRNKLLKCALDNDLIDSQGRWNYRAAFRILASSGPARPSTEEKRNVAAASTSDHKSAGGKSSMMGSLDFKKNPAKRPW